MVTSIKAKLLLLAIAVVWGLLIVLMLPFQLPVTLAGIHPRLKRYRYGVWLAQDQMVNAIFGGNHDVSVSSKLGYMSEQGSKTAIAMAKVVDWMFYVAVGQKNHCRASIERDEEHYS